MIPVETNRVFSAVNPYVARLLIAVTNAAIPVEFGAFTRSICDPTAAIDAGIVTGAAAVIVCAANWVVLAGRHPLTSAAARVTAGLTRSVPELGSAVAPQQLYPAVAGEPPPGTLEGLGVGLD